MTNKTWIVMMVAACLMMWSCDTKTKAVDSCGDGFVDPGEECDGNIGENTCASLGHYNQTGTLVCTPLCKFDTADCGGRCGDGIPNGTDGEQCDGNNLDGNSCESLGYTGGTLICAGDCTFEVSACAGRCGNGVIDADESEVCDGGNLGAETCQTQGYHGGQLSCLSDCSGYNLDACTAVGRCGDGVIQATYGEVCDGTSLGEATCEGEGYYGGNMACSGTCTLDLSGCISVGRCGDGVVQTEYWEDCDGTNLNASTCVSLGYSQASGELSCDDECVFDKGLCLEESMDADLATLTVSTGTLTPAFDASTTSYTVTVPNAVTTLTVTATAADSWASVEIMPAQPMALVEGINGATVTVTAESGAQKVYTVVITRLSPSDYLSPSIGALIHVPAGTFQRDATASNLSTVSAFRMSRYEITRAQWVTVTGWVDPSDTTTSGGVDDPVNNMNWYDAIAFCNKLSLLEGLTPVYSVSGVDFATLTYAQIPAVSNATWDAVTADWNANGYRLPTEMEWMWAAMGADTANPGAINAAGYAKAFAGSTGSNLIDDYAWYSVNSTYMSHPVGTKLSNELGFHDMSGNVFEWAWDWYDTYPTGALTDARGPDSGTRRIVRGSGWYNDAARCSVAYRGLGGTYPRGSDVGFRVVRN
ncbi:MAG: hypothetical protein CVU65_07985 [Deltaproteobacteria bacterium HGW-Deltaproteobacteria-22]|nr:MAG: hypothetical protein CVU65_07985 [Deltaproteobacteria bacterium HGW-Deltaproteobacteria-22]